jgi:hypothetical protein
MPWNFPNAPSIGQIFMPTPGIAWEWNGFAWGGITTSTVITTSDVPPQSALPNQLWFESDSGNFYIYFDDGTSVQWVQLNGTAGYATPPQNAVAVVSDTPPSNPLSGQTWYETDTGKLWIWVQDADGAQWVQVGRT